MAHELTHAVTAQTARLNGFPYSEAGALNEAFSDIFGASTAFYQLPVGNAPVNASYIIGRDLTVPPGALARSMVCPEPSMSTGDSASDPPSAENPCTLPPGPTGRQDGSGVLH